MRTIASSVGILINGCFWNALNDNTRQRTINMIWSIFIRSHVLKFQPTSPRYCCNGQIKASITPSTPLDSANEEIGLIDTHPVSVLER